MPGKKDPEYFPLNFNMELYDYDYEEDDYETEGTYPVTLPPHGKYDSDESSTRRTRNVSFNEMFVPPANSEVEEEEDEETASVQSSDIDVDEDVVDTLVLSIREKLRMGPKFSTNHHSSVANFWNETTSPSPYDSNNSGCSSSHSHSSSKRFRVHPYFSSSTWKAARPNLGSVQKTTGGGKTHCRHWWTSKSFSDLSHQRRGKSNPDSPNVDDPYQLLQELVDSGSLIKEAVRRIKTKRLGCMNRNNNTSSPSSSSSNNNHNNNIMSTGSSTVRRFTYREEDSENSYPTLPLSAQ